MSLNPLKVTRLIGLMNSKSGFSIPALPPVIKCFEHAMDSEVLDFLLRTGVAVHSEESLEQLYITMRATGELTDKYSWTELWDEIKSMCFMIPAQAGEGYEMAPIFPGWLELSTSGPRTPKNVAITESFMEFWKVLKLINFPPVRAYMDGKALRDRDADFPKMTTLTAITPAGKPSKRHINLDEPLNSEQQVLPVGTVYEILERHKDQIAVMNCICRGHKDLHGDCCDYDIPLKSCMPIGNVADQLVEYGIADKLSYEEAVDLVTDFERKGCIHTTFHYGNDAKNEELAICNCCSECCLLYGSFRKGYISTIQVKAFNKPEIVNIENCTGCAKCTQACPTLAIAYDKESHNLTFNYESCIGCGQCVTQCRFSVQHMVPDERSVFVRTRKRNSHA